MSKGSGSPLTRVYSPTIQEDLITVASVPQELTHKFTPKVQDPFAIVQMLISCQLLYQQQGWERTTHVNQAKLYLPTLFYLQFQHQLARTRTQSPKDVKLEVPYRLFYFPAPSTSNCLGHLPSGPTHDDQEEANSPPKPEPTAASHEPATVSLELSSTSPEGVEQEASQPLTLCPYS